MTLTLIDWSVRINAMADALSVPDGGFSVDPSDGSDVRSGYAVAIHPEHECVFDGPVTGNHLYDYIAQGRDVLTLPGRVLGGWRDPATGRAYLDISVVTADLSEAMTHARENRQLAIFSFFAMRSISIAVAC